MNAPPFKVACVQLTSDREVAASMALVADGVRRARDAGAELVTTPEVVSMIEAGRRRVLAKARPEAEDEALARFRELARETGAWLLAGSLIVKVEPERCANRSYLVDPSGAVVASYDKIHMFDVQIEGGESYRESSTYRPGDRAVVAQTPWGPLGLTVCYDMRFPYLYRSLAQAGARYLTVPSAFTRPTGRAHWHVLLRARAIETGCFVIAPAQCGDHPSGRKTYGHSLVVDPWGEILAEAGETPEVIVAEIDPARVDAARGQIPALEHDRPYAAPEAAPGRRAAAS